MNYQSTTVTFAGLELDAFKTEDGQKWVTLSSMAKGLDINRSTSKNWIERHNTNKVDTLPVHVGKRRKPAEAYPVGIVGLFVEWLAQRGNTHARALLTSTFIADLERTIDESLGVVVSATQHETNRAVRMDLILEYMKGYKPFINGKRQWIDSIEGFTTVEVKVAGKLAYIAEKEYQLADPELTTSERELLLERIADARDEIATM